MATLDVNDIQGNILHGYNFPAGVYTFVRVPDADRGRQLLRDLLPQITNAGIWRRPPATAVNVAVTHAGLTLLKVDKAVLADLPAAFSEPIRKRAERVLGDIGASRPSRWETGLGSRRQPAHFLVMLAFSSDDKDQHHAAVQELDACLMRNDALTVGDRQYVHALEGSREHFGYADGFGQPAIEGVARNWPGQGTVQRDTGAWNDVKAGEFILGHLNEDGDCVSGAATWLLRNGSYMVYRKLEQNVPAFQQALKEAADGYVRATGSPLSPEDGFEELMAAKLVGRWRDGIALELDPRRLDKLQARGLHIGDLSKASTTPVDNTFRYDGDLSGFICPRGAHIRRANPRDLLGGDGTESRRHRIIRRGMPYEEDTGERGLIFICFNADLERQFEVIQGQWCIDGNAFKLGADQDYLLGNGAGSATKRRPGKVTIEGEPPVLVPARPDLVVTRGCEYLLMPGLKALRRLSAPRSWETTDRTSDLEQVPAGEEEAIARIVNLVREEMHRNYASERPVRRGQHPKSNGCVRAKFIVGNDVPPELKAGLFASPKKYDAWVRFSGSHSALQSDAKSDAHGMAVKVLDVSGDKVLMEGHETNTQDFVMVNYEAFFCRDAAAYAKFAEVISPTGSLQHLPRRSTLLRVLAFYLSPSRRSWGWRGLRNLRAVTRQKVANPLEVQYWSQTPFALAREDGRTYAVKYSAKPCNKKTPRTESPQDYDGLEDVLAAALKREDAQFRFEFQIQLQADTNKMPVEDPTVTWNDTNAPFKRVATIEIAHDENALSQRRQSRGERLTFSPWHTLVAHRPLGGINRVRRAVYLASSELRHELDNTQHEEPQPDEFRPTFVSTTPSDVAPPNS